AAPRRPSTSRGAAYYEARLMNGVRKVARGERQPAVRHAPHVHRARRELFLEEFGDLRRARAAEPLGHVRERGVALGGVAAGAGHLVDRLRHLTGLIDR